MDPSPGREELLLLSRQPRAWKSGPFPAAALSSTTRWGRGPRRPLRALDWGRRGLCSSLGRRLVWHLSQGTGVGTRGHSPASLGTPAVRGRGERARKAAPRPRLRLRGLANASVARFSAAQPPGSPTLARRVPAHTRTLHSATHRHTYALAWPHPRDAHLPAGSRTQDWSRPHAASRAGWAARSLLRLRTHTGVHVFSSLSRTWLATLHLARASAGQRPSPGAARGQTQQVPAAL